MEFPYYLVIAAIGVSFYASFMGGANDFANAFGTSVGSGAITIRQAVLIAIMAELIGAVLVGAHVTDTVRKGIIDTTGFDADVLMFGLLASLVGSGLFLQLATHYGLPVSTTHAIVGAIIGFGLVATGFESVRWGNVGNIAMSWVISPIGGAVVAYTTFRIIQNRVLERAQPIVSAARVVPFFVGTTAMVLTLSMIYKGLKNLKLDLSLPEAIGYAAIVGLLTGIVTRQWMRSRIDDQRSRQEQLIYVEVLFKYLQIFTAGYVAFAHGSNDVANGIGPLAGIWTIYNSDGIIGLKTPVPIWILIMGGTGIVLGLAVFGKRVIETVGTKITLVTPSRGFAAEFAAATVVLIFSKMGMPVSTTHTLVGSVIGVGLARGIGAIDLRVVRKIFMSWIVTIPLAALATAITFILLRAIF